MADRDNEALQRRIATLEAQVAALLQAISADRGGNVVINAPGSLTVNCGHGIALTTGGAMTLTAGANLAIAAGANAGLTAGNRLRVSSGQEASFETRSFNVAAAVGCTINSGQNLAVTCGKEIAVTAGKTVSIQGSDAAALKSGAAALNLKKDGSAELQGRDITLKASGRIDAKASSQVALKGSKIFQN
ncbi:DUF2345 domain-containing protein [Bosea sp. (in: a-proteobacteria)]|uniref:DUF2345 domain-containing protein n=1 Tax=Bosea sp. (in: a-proteobacteria) TaxID=1871050 RepID=UPI00262112D7|nr:DUF2345 domain-containing protein [Bosea sp. (in: a-proteobacteria)]MCO5092489.1 DUF2345 domain-containing protein [Bosea sp. (in: a-proteobacteria)]